LRMLSERQRQKRRERKAQKRRAKKARGQAGPEPTILFGTGLPKMSDTVVDFADPFLTTLPKTEAAWRAGLQVAALVWNGIIVEKSREEIVALLRQVLEPGTDVVGLVHVLTERKQRLFPDDDRFIFGLEARQDGDRIDVSAVSGFAR
jgi:hypothetical protein